jgi:hypothetical protein
MRTALNKNQNGPRPWKRPAPGTDRSLKGVQLAAATLFSWKNKHEPGNR